jgi:AraC-like ligand binding domain
VRAPYRVLALDDVEAVPGPAALAWRPLRAELGLHAFGLGSFRAQEAGDDVIEPHTETPGGRGHEELYFVVRGAARFTLDGEAFDAPAGTFVLVRDPRVHRHGVATEPHTEVLAFGGDAVFQPSGSEVMWRVRALLPQRVDRARDLADAALEEVPESPGASYAQALVAAAERRCDDAREWLARAVEREPRLLAEARGEALLAGLAGGSGG